MAKGVKAGVLGLGTLGWDQTAIDDVGQRLHLADSVGEREITLALGALDEKQPAVETNRFVAPPRQP